MRIHPISFALQYLKGRRTIHGKSPCSSKAEALRVLREFTGQDFGTDAVKWGEWLRKNRKVYYSYSPTRK
jgi:hypothetical protein